MCLTQFLTERDNVVAGVKNGDYDDEDHSVFAPMANMDMHAGQLSNTVRAKFKHYFNTEAGRMNQLMLTYKKKKFYKIIKLLLY